MIKFKKREKPIKEFENLNNAVKNLRNEIIKASHIDKLSDGQLAAAGIVMIVLSVILLVCIIAGVIK